MQRLLILGGGTAGTMAANRLRRELHRDEWRITVVDQSDQHIYQPGLLLIPFGTCAPHDVARPRRQTLRDGVELIPARIERVDAEDNNVLLVDGRRLPYDYLVIATGTHTRPDQTPGMLGPGWHRSIHEFYTESGAVALADALKDFDRGRLVVHIVDMPIKFPVAPLEFAFLADAYFRQRGLRDSVEIVFATPLPGAFTQPIASARLGAMLTDREITLESDFRVERIDPRAKNLVSHDDRKIPFDLLVTVPLNMGADYVAASGLGNERNYVPVDRHTFLSTAYDNIFAIGDAADLPTSKAGSVAHYSVEVFVRNFPRYAAGKPMTEKFDGHASCFIESGGGKGLLIDFNYDTEPLPGHYPLPAVGPFGLLAENTRNHWGKLAFRAAYWHLLLPGRPLPLPAHMPRAGKHEVPQE
jgi:sulfide:quinone oxidoreductase